MPMRLMAGEDLDFVDPISTNGDQYRSGYARCSIVPVADGYMARTKPFPSGPITSCWLRVRIYHWGNTNEHFFGLGRSGQAATYAGLWIGSTANAGLLAIKTYDGANWVVKATSNINVGTFTDFLDVQLIDYGTNATVNLYKAGQLLVTYTGDISVGSITDVDQVIIRRCNGYYRFSEIMVADEDLRATSLATLAPNAVGDLNQWTGAYTDINENPWNDASLLYANGAGLDAQFNLSNLPSGTWGVAGIKVAARAARSAGSAVTKLQLGVKSGGQVDVDAGQTVDVPFLTYERIASQINGAGLTQAQVDAMQINLRSAA